MDPPAPARLRILDVFPRVASHRSGGSQRRLSAIFDVLEERHDLVCFCQPRLADRRLPALAREDVNRRLAPALLTEIGEVDWPTAPILAGAALRLGGVRALRDRIGWADVVMVEFPWHFGACARHARGKPLVLATHNVEVDKFHEFADAARVGRARRLPWIALVERMERDAVRRADLLLAVSEADRGRLVERHGAEPARIAVAPNCADVDRIAPATPERRAAAKRALDLGTAPVVLFAGADVTPNRRALDWVHAAAALVPELTFAVVGRVGGRPCRRGNVLHTGYVEEFEPWLEAADIGLCTVEFGGGTKLKLIESLAAGLPSVALPGSVRGLDVRHEEHLLVAGESAESIAGALRRLAADPAEAERLGRAARDYAVARHDRRNAAGVIERALLDAVASSGSAPQRRNRRAGGSAQVSCRAG